MDLHTRRTPFSGSTGTLPKWPEAAPQTLVAGIVTLAIVSLVGSYFLWVRGPWLLPLGIFAMLVVAASLLVAIGLFVA